MQTRRDFLKTATLATLGLGMGVGEAEAALPLFNINRRNRLAPCLRLRFFPYELKLRHVFTVATYSRSTTPDVQVEIDYDGITGYGEASMPPYLQKELGSLESVMAFLKQVQARIGQFTDPFRLEDILSWVDGLSEGNAAAKAAVDIALHDLVGKLLQALFVDYYVVIVLFFGLSTLFRGGGNGLFGAARHNLRLAEPVAYAVYYRVVIDLGCGY